MRVGVFCSGREDVSPLLLSEIEQLGHRLALDGHDVVFGGASPGCMGALARGVLKANGKLIGVVPLMDFMEGIVQSGMHETHEVPTLSSRKAVMMELSDAFVVYPGGLGTLDEAFEALALKSLGSQRKPIIFYNFLDIWTPLVEALSLLSEQNLIREPIDQLIHVVDNLRSLSESLKHV
jgi:uncharacterized protein (TIGR00730 family)